MRIPFVVGTARGGRSEIVVAPGRIARPFPGPWTLAGVFRNAQRPETTSPPASRKEPSAR